MKLTKEMKEAIQAEKIDNEYKEYGFDYYVNLYDKKKLSNLLIEKDNFEDTTETKGDYIFCLNRDNTIGIEAKSPAMNEFLSVFVEREEKVKYDKKEVKYSCVAVELLIDALKVFKMFTRESVKIGIARDGLIVLENDECKVFVAPRVEED